MQAKKIIRETKDFKKARDEVSKEDDVRSIYVRVPCSLYKKLKAELLRRRIPMSKWVHEKIKEIE